MPDPTNEGRYFARGNHSDAYLDYWCNAGHYSQESCPAGELVYVAARDIEGIPLYRSEVEDPQGFWGRRTGGTRQTFVEITRKIPAVQAQLDAGKTLDDIEQEYPGLADCVGIYFRNAPQVSVADGFYVFETNGRHRILSAQSIGARIPVRITGRIRRR